MFPFNREHDIPSLLCTSTIRSSNFGSGRHECRAEGPRLRGDWRGIGALAGSGRNACFWACQHFNKCDVVS